MFRSSFACLGLASLSFLMPLSAQASCYGTGFSRFCDGIGGPGSTYTPLSDNGMTDYYGPNGLSKTVIRTELGPNLQMIETLRSLTLPSLALPRL